MRTGIKKKKKRKDSLSLFHRLAVMRRMAHDQVQGHQTRDDRKHAPDDQRQMMERNPSMPQVDLVDY